MNRWLKIGFLAVLYCAWVGFEDLDSARQSQIEGSAAPGLMKEHHSQIGKGDDEDRFDKIAASPNLQNLPTRSIFSLSHAAPLSEALSALKESPYGFTIFDVGITAEDLENFGSINIQKEWIYHQFGELEIIQESIANFFGEIGPNGNEVAARAAIRLKEVTTKVVEASGKETAWVCLRSFTPTDRFDLPRWHVDGPYYNRSGPEDLLFKFVVTLVGPTTLFYPLSRELRQTTERVVHNRQYMKNLCRKENIISPKLGEGAVFIGGQYTAITALHSEPSIHENRLFLSIVPCTEKQLVALKLRVAAVYPKDSRE